MFTHWSPIRSMCMMMWSSDATSRRSPATGRLAGEQREDRLVDLEVASVDPIVVGDHQLCELDVLMGQRLERPVQLLDHEVEAGERVRFELRELLVELRPDLPVRRVDGAALSSAGSSKPAGDVVLGALIGRAREQLLGVVVLDEDAGAPPVAHVEAEESGALGDARRLLHVVGHDDERVVAFEVVHQLLDRGRGDRVERRGGLVEQQDVGLDRDRARDAQALLLAAGEPEGGLA